MRKNKVFEIMDENINNNGNDNNKYFINKILSIVLFVINLIVRWMRVIFILEHVFYVILNVVQLNVIVYNSFVK